MPKFRYLCSHLPCANELERYASPSQTQVECPKCHQPMNQQFPGSGSQVVREVVDDFTNVRTASDEKAQNQARKTEYFWEVEVPRLIQTYSLETCLQEKWLTYNDKGELVVNKPPSKR